MEINLPAYEDIYDFNEADLNFYHSKISECLKSNKDLTEKWQRKGQRILELIQTELEERIAINQIASFCNKELDSDLYKEVFSEDFSQGSTDVRDSVELTLANEELKEESVSEKMWNMRKSKKNYKDFVRNTLKNTQQANGLVIGGSSVPVVKQNKPEEKPKIEVKEKNKRDVKFEVKKNTAKVGNKAQDKGLKKDVDLKNSKNEKGGAVSKGKEEGQKKAAVDVRKGKVPSDDLTGKRKAQVSGVDAGNKEKKVSLAEKKIIPGNEVRAEDGVKKVEGNGEEVEGKEFIVSGNFKDERFDTDECREDVGGKEDRSGEMNKVDQGVNKEPCQIILRDELDLTQHNKFPALNESESSEYKNELLGANTLDPNTENFSEITLNTSENYNKSFESQEFPQESNRFIQSDIDKEESCRFTSQSDANKISLKSDSESKNIAKKNFDIKESEKIYTDKNDSEKKLSVEANPDEKILNEPTNSNFKDLKPSSSHSELTKGIKKDLHPDEYKKSDQGITESLLKSSSSGSLSNQKLSKTNSSGSIESVEEKASVPSTEYKRKTEPNFDSYKPDLEGLADLKALKEKILSSKLKTSESKPVPAPQPEVSQSKPIQKPPPKAKKPVAALTQYTDYTTHYSSFFEIFSGYNLSKDFSPLNSLRESLQTFKEFVNLIDSPEFEVHKKFKLTLAPLEINPRDLVRGDEHNYPVFPSEKEMYYRVVKSRPEVYDIVSRGLNKKKAWSELPHGLNLRFSWNLMWTWSKPSLDFSKLLVWQVVNHFPETKNFSRKDMLKKNIEKIMKVSTKAHSLWNIIPITYVLPKEYVNFVDHYGKLEETEPDKNVWIMKPVGKSRGRGISVINDVNQVSYGEIMVIQRYISNPLLLEGYKFDLRLYILITKFAPLEAFLYKEGFARMSTVPFSMNPDKLQNKYIHLTNFSIQKYNTRKDDSLDAILGGSKICLKTLQERLSKMGINWDKIWTQIVELIIKSLIAVQNEIPSYPCCFDLVGYDVMIDQNLQTWLVEINSSPSLARENYLDDLIKQQLIDDTLELVNPLYFNKQELVKVLERRTGEVQKGHVNNTVAQMNQDLHKILDGKKPRKYGEMPEKIGNYEMISPSPLYEKLYKVAYPRG